MRARLLLGIALLLALDQSISAAVGQWKAGIAKVRITPERPIWLTGFAARTNVSQGTAQELYAKAVALEEASGARAVLVTSDLLGFPAEVCESIAEDVKRQHGLARERLLFNSSHTHGAPALDSRVHFIYGPRANPEQWRAVEESMTYLPTSRRGACWKKAVTREAAPWFITCSPAHPRPPSKRRSYARRTNRWIGRGRNSRL